MGSERSPETEKLLAEDLLNAISHIHSAHTNVLMVLVKSLHVRGALNAEDFEADLRRTTEYFRDQIGSEVTRYILDFADRINPTKGRA